MRAMVWPTCFRIHTYDDSLESRNLWHDLIVSDAYSSEGGNISERKSMMRREAVMDVTSAWS